MQLESSYPYNPGWKDSDTSKQAAKKVANKSAELREAILLLLERHQLSCDSIAYHLRQPITTIRPRVTELLAQGLIEDSGQRTRTEGGCNAKVWRLKPQQPRYRYDEIGQGVMFG